MPKRSQHRITDRFIKSLPAPDKRYRIYYDADIAGFGCRISATGQRAFVLNYLVSGRERRITIGDYPTWSSSAAREQARSLKRSVDIGHDPLADRNAARTEQMERSAAPTVRDLFERYAEEHLPKKSRRSAVDDRSMWLKDILPRLGDRRVADLAAEDADALHAAISETRPVRANRIIEVFRKALNLAIRWEWIAINPAVGVQKNREQKREMFLTVQQIARLRSAIEEEPDRTAADAIELLLLTGARKTEVLRASWSEFDLIGGVWTKPSAHTKQRRVHRTPLSSAALALLTRRRTETDGDFLFPNRIGDAPIHDLRRPWFAICQRAGFSELRPARTKAGEPVIDDYGDPVLVERATLRLHDLRHTFASVLASSGASLPLIGALLGHTQAQTTERYAHLLDDALRQAAEAASNIIHQT